MASKFGGIPVAAPESSGVIIPPVNSGRVSRFGGVPVGGQEGTSINEDLPVMDADGTVRDFPVQPQQESGLGERLLGAGEAGLAMATGATGGAAGMIGGTVKGILDEMVAGKFGTQEAADRIEKAATDAGAALTYEPRTQSGQEQVQAIGETLGPLAAIGPLTSEVTAIAQGAKAATPAARAVAGNAISKAADLIPARSAPLVDDMSVGAAQTEAALRRATTAESLPVPVKLTKGAETRNPDQLAFEKEQMKTAIGQPLRNRAEENNLQILQNFDSIIDDTGSGAIDVASTGNKVIDTLSKGYKSAKARTHAAYSKARNSEESNAPVDLASKVKLGDESPDTSLVDYLNSRPTGVASSGVTDAARKYAVKMGVAVEDGEGNLKPLPVTVGKMEDFRKEVSGIASRSEPGQVRDETIIKKLVDAHTAPVAGDLYKAARAERTKQARKYENRAIVARLITNRKGGDDPKVAADQVFQRSIINASPEEINFLRRVMLTSGPGGRQAWKDVQGAMVEHIRKESTKGLGTDSNGQPMVSPAKLNQVINALDSNDRLDVVLGKKNAQIVRDLNDVAKYVTTVPPGTLINNSGTAGTIMAAITEAGILGATSGIPVPVLSGLRAISKAMKNKKMKAKIDRALNNMKPDA